MASFNLFRTQVSRKVLGVLFACVLAHSSMAGQAQPQLPQANDATDAASEDCDLGKANYDGISRLQCGITSN
jgi:hypothetical protein